VKTTNGGSTWTIQPITAGDISASAVTFLGIDIYDISYGILGGKNFLYKSTDGFVTWTPYSLSSQIRNILSVDIGQDVLGYFLLLCTDDTLNTIWITRDDASSSGANTEGNKRSQLAKMIKNVNTNVWNIYSLCYDTSLNECKYIVKYNYFTALINDSTYTQSPTARFYDLAIVDISNVVVVGSDLSNALILSSNNAGSTWTPNTSIVGRLCSVSIYDTSSVTIGMAVGDGGLIVWSPNVRDQTWQILPSEYLNGVGNVARFSQSNFSQVVIVDLNTVSITTTEQIYQNGQRGNSFVFSLYVPGLFNLQNNHVMDICGNENISGNLRVENQMSIGYTFPYSLNPAYTLDVSGLIQGTLNTPSDYRIKENIVELTATDSVDALRPYRYYNKRTKREEIGFLAHELQEIFPLLVEGEKDGEYLQSVNYMSLIGILVKEIQELKRKFKN
jgi:photosystem II stability/assembly factor-like uncharacterized protein